MKIKTNLKIIEWNCNSLISKLELIKQFIRANKPDILLLNETKCSQELANLNVQVNGYDFLINPRKVNPNFGGGVAMFINNKLSYNQVNEFNSFDEFLAIKTKTKNTNINKCARLDCTET
jgi:exonuclease III